MASKVVRLVRGTMARSPPGPAASLSPSLEESRSSVPLPLPLVKGTVARSPAGAATRSSPRPAAEQQTALETGTAAAA